MALVRSGEAEAVHTLAVVKHESSLARVRQMEARQRQDEVDAIDGVRDDVRARMAMDVNMSGAEYTHLTASQGETASTVYPAPPKVSPWEDVPVADGPPAEWSQLSARSLRTVLEHVRHAERAGTRWDEAQRERLMELMRRVEHQPSTHSRPLSREASRHASRASSRER